MLFLWARKVKLIIFNHIKMLLYHGNADPETALGYVEGKAVLNPKTPKRVN